MATTKVRTSTQVNVDEDLDIQSHKLINVTDPTAAQDAATKAYVDANSGLTAVDFVADETPTGTIDGINDTFTLAFTPVAGSVRVRLNGLGQKVGAGNDYTISGLTITYLAAPKTGDTILVDYIKA